MVGGFIWNFKESSGLKTEIWEPSDFKEVKPWVVSGGPPAIVHEGRGPGVRPTQLFKF